MRQETRPPAGAAPASSLAQFVIAVARNAIPVWGFFHQGWSPATTLVVYWAETLIGTLLISLRMAIHRQLTHKRGYDIEEAPATITVTSGRAGQPKQIRMGFVTGFLVGALAFTLVHGLFLVLLLKIVLPQTGGGYVDSEELTNGVVTIGACLLLNFVLDLVGLRQRPFAWIRSMSQGTFARIVVMQMTIILGMGLTMLIGRAQTIFTVFVVLKFLVDLSAHIPQWGPKEAPAWLSRTMDRAPGKSERGEDFASYWKRTEAQVHAREAEDERVDS